jgi:hypothetical protein
VKTLKFAEKENLVFDWRLNAALRQTELTEYGEKINAK